MSENKFHKIKSIIDKTKDKPTIINPGSNFVVVTYWWGRGNNNKNTTRACGVFHEQFFDNVILMITKLLNSKSSDKHDQAVIGLIKESLKDGMVGETTKYANARNAFLSLKPIDQILKKQAKVFYNMVKLDMKMTEKNLTYQDVLAEVEKRKSKDLPIFKDKSKKELLDMIDLLHDIVIVSDKRNRTKPFIKISELETKDEEELHFIANELLSKIVPHKYMLENRVIRSRFTFRTQEDSVIFLKSMVNKLLEECAKSFQ